MLPLLCVLKAEEFLITGNMATSLGSAVYADEMSSAATLQEIVHSPGRTSMKTSRCAIQFPTDPTVRERAIKVCLEYLQ